MAVWSRSSPVNLCVRPLSNQLIFDNVNIGQIIQQGHEKLQSVAVALRWTMYCWIGSSSCCDIDVNVIRWTMGFDFWVTNASIISSSRSVLVVKNLGLGLIIMFWTDSSAQLDNWMLVWEVGMSVILVKTSQSIQNFLNFWAGHFKVELGKLSRWCLCIDGLGRGLPSLFKDRESFFHCCDSQLF